MAPLPEVSAGFSGLFWPLFEMGQPLQRPHMYHSSECWHVLYAVCVLPAERCVAVWDAQVVWMCSSMSQLESAVGAMSHVQAPALWCQLLGGSTVHEGTWMQCCGAACCLLHLLRIAPSLPHNAGLLILIVAGLLHSRSCAVAMCAASLWLCCDW